MPQEQQHSLLAPFGWQDRFELVEKIGKGAMGQVWKAWEHGVEARPAPWAFGLAGDDLMDQGLQDLPADEFAAAHQGRLEGCHVEVLDEVLEESGIAEGDETCLALLCLMTAFLAAICSANVAFLSFRVCSNVNPN